MNRRNLLSAGPTVLTLIGANANGAVQGAEANAPRSFYSTLSPQSQAALDHLRDILDAKAEGRYVAPPDPDAEVHALCAEFERLHALAYLDGNDGWEADHHASFRVADKIDGMCALTESGHRAKARVAILQLEEHSINGEYAGGSDGQFALNTLRDWLDCLGMAP